MAEVVFWSPHHGQNFSSKTANFSLNVFNNNNSWLKMCEIFIGFILKFNLHSMSAVKKYFGII